MFNRASWAAFHTTYTARIFDLVVGGLLGRLLRLVRGPRPTTRAAWSGEIAAAATAIVVAGTLLVLPAAIVALGDVVESHADAFGLAALGLFFLTEWQGRRERAARYLGETGFGRLNFRALAAITVVEMLIIGAAITIPSRIDQPWKNILLGLAFAASADLINTIWTPILIFTPLGPRLLGVERSDAAPHEEGPELTAPEGLDPEGVSELSLIAKETLADERARGLNLDAKTASLAAATGVILSLNATLGRSLLSADVGHIGVWVVRVAFVAGIVLLVASLLAAVLGVLTPQKRAVLERGTIRNFVKPKTLTMSKTNVQLAMLQTVSEILDDERARNGRKATASKISAILLAAGLLAVSAEASTLGVWKLIPHHAYHIMKFPKIPVTR